MTAPRVLLLNPPSPRPVLRDYYCSTWPKARYYWQPIDLLAVGARLWRRTRLRIIDAVAMRLSAAEVAAQVRAFQPSALFVLASSLTRHGDLALAQTLKPAGARLLIGGEVALDADFDFALHPGVDALALDFTAPEAAAWLLGAAPEGRMRTATLEPEAPGRASEPFSLGLMPHDTLLRGRYRLPLWGSRFHSLLTDFGCPFTCDFCNSGRTSIGYRTRDVAEVGAELRWLHRSQARRLYLRDMTFAGDKRHHGEVLDRLAHFDFELRGYLRADLIDPPLVRALRRAGFTMGQIGVEHPQADARAEMGKRVGDPVVERAFALLKEQGIAAGAHFVIGVGDEASGVAAECRRYAETLGAAYCSINVYAPRHGIAALPAPPRQRRTALLRRAQFEMLRFHASPRRWL